MRAVIVAALLVVACGGSQDLEAARRASYDTDRAVVFREALAATEAVFPSAQGDEVAGTIATAWHQVDRREVRKQPTTGSLDTGGIIARQGFVRFDIAITGGPPWRVVVTTHGHEVLPGAQPSSVRDDTPWLVPPTNKLVGAIHARLKAYAVVSR